MAEIVEIARAPEPSVGLLTLHLDKFGISYHRDRIEEIWQKNEPLWATELQDYNDRVKALNEEIQNLAAWQQRIYSLTDVIRWGAYGPLLFLLLVGLRKHQLEWLGEEVPRGVMLLYRAGVAPVGALLPLIATYRPAGGADGGQIVHIVTRPGL
ncbi:MAG: hypothetical protein AB7F31_04000 [Parachlamydiales bacterium]